MEQHPFADVFSDPSRLAYWLTMLVSLGTYIKNSSLLSQHIFSKLTFLLEILRVPGLENLHFVQNDQKYGEKDVTYQLNEQMGRR